MNVKTKLILALIVLALIDTVTPIPITSLILIYGILQRPTWFKDVVREIYATR